MKRAESSVEDELVALETGALDPARFPHPEHVRLGYEMLGRYAFSEAVARFARGLKLLAAKGGRPEVYHETITVAFLALIGERRARGDAKSWTEFKTNNTDLLDKRCLEKWYDTEQLGSDLARQTFCLPRPPAEEGRRTSTVAAATWLTDSRALAWYSAVFSTYIIWSSAVTLYAHGHQQNIRVLASTEIIAAALFAVRRTRLFGLIVLLAVFSIAIVAEFVQGGVPVRFLFYTASALLIARQGGANFRSVSLE